MSKKNLLKFEALNDDEHDLLNSQTIEVVYNRTGTIFKQGEFVTKAVYVKSGYVKFYKDHKNLTSALFLLPPGNFACLPFGFTHNKFLYSISAFAGTIVYQTDIETIRELFQKNGKFAFEIMEQVNHTLINYHLERLYQITSGNAMSKTVRSLVFLAEKVFFSDSFDMLLTRVELAQIAGISRENTIKSLSALHRNGIIRISGRNIRIIDREKLWKLGEFDSPLNAGLAPPVKNE